MSERVLGRIGTRRPMWLVLILALCLTMGPLLWGCNSGRQPAPTSVSSKDPGTRGTDSPVTSPTPATTSTEEAKLTTPEGIWTLDSLGDRSLVEGSIVTLRVRGSSFWGVDGCSLYSGGSEVGSGFRADGTFVPSDFGATDMGCPEPEGVLEQAEAFQSALTAGERYRVSRDRMEILNSLGTTTLVFVRQTPLPGRPVDLRGTAWKLLMAENAEVDPGTATLDFADRLVIATTPCGRAYHMSWTSERYTLFTSLDVRGSDESCTREAKRKQGQYTDFLSTAWEYSVYEHAGSRRLAIRSATGKTLIFEPLPFSRRLKNVV